MCDDYDYDEERAWCCVLLRSVRGVVHSNAVL